MWVCMIPKGWTSSNLSSPHHLLCTPQPPTQPHTHHHHHTHTYTHTPKQGPVDQRLTKNLGYWFITLLTIHICLYSHFHTISQLSQHTVICSQAEKQNPKCWWIFSLSHHCSLQKVISLYGKYGGHSFGVEDALYELFIEGKNQNADSVENVIWVVLPLVEMGQQWFISVSCLVLFGTNSLHF